MEGSQTKEIPGLSDTGDRNIYESEKVVGILISQRVATKCHIQVGYYIKKLFFHGCIVKNPVLGIKKSLLLQSMGRILTGLPPASNGSH